jgi:methionyl-tRNA formyltransferase
MTTKLNILLAGQKRFGRDALALITELGHNVVAVACPAFNAGERDEDKLHFAASEARHRIIPAGTLDQHTMPEGVDLIVCAHSHDFIGRKTRAKAKLGAIGYHPSLLPLHRGRDAVRWAVRLRERVTGGSVYWLNETVDGGPIAAQDFVLIRPDDDALELWKRDLAPLGIKLLRKALTDIAAGRIVRVPQDKELATWEPGLSTAPLLYRPDLEMLPAPGSSLTYIVTRE